MEQFKPVGLGTYEFENRKTNTMFFLQFFCNFGHQYSYLRKKIRDCSTYGPSTSSKPSLNTLMGKFTAAVFHNDDFECRKMSLLLANITNF